MTKRGQASYTKPVARTLKYLREFGMDAEYVESKLSFGGKLVSKDVLGLADIVAYDPNIPPSIIFVQACAVSGLAKHKTKAAANPWLLRLLRSGVCYIIYSWRPWEDEERRNEPVMSEAVILDGALFWIEGDGAKRA